MISCSAFNDINYGRFGNQLFQYSLSKVLSIIHNSSFNLVYDGNFVKFFNKKELTASFSNTPNFSKYDYVEQDAFEFDPKILECTDINLIGFFQNLDYFSEYKKILVKELYPNQEYLNKAQEYISRFSSTDESVCMHIRRTDYTVLQHKHGFLNAEYYTNILDNLEYNKVFVISDDINLVQQEFDKIGYNQDLIFVNELDAVLDFCIMYLCRLNIVPNSTFSWWPAYLSDTGNKKVYIIDKWINESNTSQEKINLYPEHWIKVSQSEHKWKRLFV